MTLIQIKSKEQEYGYTSKPGSQFVLWFFFSKERGCPWLPLPG